MKLVARANHWMEENPLAYKLFKLFALEICRCNKKFGAKMVAERIRWECHLTTTGEFKWNNSHTTYVAKRFIQEFPQYEHLIQFRPRKEEL